MIFFAIFGNNVRRCLNIHTNYQLGFLFKKCPIQPNTLNMTLTKLGLPQDTPWDNCSSTFCRRLLGRRASTRDGGLWRHTSEKNGKALPSPNHLPDAAAGETSSWWTFCTNGFQPPSLPQEGEVWWPECTSTRTRPLPGASWAPQAPPSTSPARPPNPPPGAPLWGTSPTWCRWTARCHPDERNGPNGWTEYERRTSTELSCLVIRQCLGPG